MLKTLHGPTPHTRFTPSTWSPTQIFGGWDDEGNDEYKENRITVQSWAYSLRLECTSNRLLKDESKNTFQPSFEVEENQENVTVRFSDRGCAMRRTFPIPTLSHPFFMDIWADNSCTTQDLPSRLNVMMAHYRENETVILDGLNMLNNPWSGFLSIFSCIPHYESTPGQLIVSWSWPEVAQHFGQFTESVDMALMMGVWPTIHDFVALGPSVTEPFPESHAFLDGVASVQEAAPASYPGPTVSMFGRMLNNKVESYFAGPYTDVYYRIFNYSSIYLSPDLVDSKYLPQALEECLTSTYRIALSEYGFYYGILAPEVTKQGKEGSGHILTAGSEVIITTTQPRLKAVSGWLIHC